MELADETLSSEVEAELVAAVGRGRAPSLRNRLTAASRAYARDRYEEAQRITRQLVREAPESAAVRELHGLVCYRLGRWREAVTHLEAARARNDDPSQLPVLMDCHRAMGHHRRVDALWGELRAASAPADVLVEGRLVLAEDLAERGEPEAAIALLSSAGGARNLRRPADRHVRQWYVLADLHERVGDVPTARALFARVVAADPELADAADRLRALGSPRTPSSRRDRRASR
jgi:tetratricopeptide (TPR) repeat protein